MCLTVQTGDFHISDTILGYLPLTLMSPLEAQKDEHYSWETVLQSVEQLHNQIVMHQ